MPYLQKTSKGRIGITTLSFPCFSKNTGSGVGTYCYILANGLVDNGYQVDIIMPPQLTDPNEDDSRDGWISFIYTPPIGNIHYYVSKILSKRKNKYIAFIKYLELIKCFSKTFKKIIEKNIKYLAIECFNGIDQSILTRYKIPNITYIHGANGLYQAQVYNKASLMCSLRERYELLCMQKASLVCAPSEMVAQYYRKYGIKIVTQYPPVMLTEVHETAAKSQLVFPGRLVVFFASALSYAKGVKTLISIIPQVVQRVPNVLFVIAGQDDDYSAKSLNEYFLSLGLADNVTCIGYIPWQEIRKYYECCDIFLSTSLSESFGLNIAEAMLCKKAVICTENTGVSELISDRMNGIVVKPKNDEQIVQAIVDLYTDSNLRNSMGTEANITINQVCGVESFIDRHIALIQSLSS